MFNTIGNLAGFLNILSLLFALVSIYSFIKSISQKKWLRLARISFHIMNIGIVLMSIILLILIIGHQYQYTYVFHNSSNELPLGILLSTFYAGQEGSFLLWVFFLAVIGIFFIRYIRRNGYESEAMIPFTLIIFFLLLLVILKSPFEKVWITFPEAIKYGKIPQGINFITLGANAWIPIPADGYGLNPLLQNFWMQIHPPVLFIGFALVSIPFSIAVAGLIKKDFFKWIHIAAPWLIFGSMVLGAGIILGGFWAYETLGWGGYWGWDPVENSSLIPWIICNGFIHTIIIQRKSGGLIKTNFLLAIIAFILVVYSTFLTRSGVLESSSVHSFTKPGSEVYLVLIVFLSGFLLTGFGLFLYRLKDIQKPKNEFRFLSREAALSFGSIVLIISAIIIFIGTSYPIFFKSNVDISFYNNWNLPLAILISFLNVYSLYISWNNDKFGVLKKSFVAGVLSLLFTIAVFISGVKDFIILIFILGSFFVVFANIEKLFKVIKVNRLKMGAFIAHIGIALIFLGIVGSGKYSRSVNIELPLNQTVKAFDYNLTYLGEEQFENGKKSYFNVRIEKDGKSDILKPVMFFTQMNDAIMKIPDIKVTVFKDIYFAPHSLEAPQGKDNNRELEKGKIDTIDNKKLTFLDYKFNNQDMESMKTGGEFSISAEVLINFEDGKSEVLNLETKFNQNGPEFKPILSKTQEFELILKKVVIDPGQLPKAQIIYTDLSKRNLTKPETLTAEISIKPFISVFWAGNIIMILGFFISMIRRWKDIKVEVSFYEKMND